MHNERSKIDELITGSGKNETPTLLKGIDSEHQREPRVHAQENPSRTYTSAGVLTRREVEVLQAMADGNSYKQIGRILGTVESTVGTQVKKIIRRLKARNGKNAVAIGFRQGMIR